MFYPTAQKKATENAVQDTFEAVFNEWWLNRVDSLSENTATNIKKRITTNALPYIGALPVTQINSKLVLEVTRRIEGRGLGETARRVVQIIGQVMRYAIATGRCENDPTPALRGALKPVVVKHHSAILDKTPLGEFLSLARVYPSSPLVRAALLLQVMLFVRPGELRQAEWTEIDCKSKVWKIPAEKMKMRVAHTVQLAAQAIGILEDLRPLTGHGKWVFPSHRSTERPMSENAVTVALRSMGYDGETVTGHGFRATARTLLVEELRFSPDVVEMQLAHAVRDPLGRAYNRTTFIGDRTKMMQAWADWLDSIG
uniref:Putative Phage integrase n=1 Tax=mine drainage metagenome TaxID=410659 RepID=E6QQN8_9ZZZZ